MTNSDVPLYKIENYLIDIFPDGGLWGSQGWGSRAYHPHYQQWFHLAECHLTQEGALEEARNQIRDWMREQAIVEASQAFIEQLQQSGYSLSEIFNGLAELSFRCEYPGDICSFLEKCSAQADD